jgi:hypothetical protein
MKTKILILFLSLLTFAGYSQTDIKANNVKVAQTLTVTGTTTLTGTTNIAKLNLSDSTKLKNVTITGEIDIKKPVPSLKMTSTGNNQTYNVLQLSNQKLIVGNGSGITVEGTGGANTMYVQGNNGNVGIGTDVPTSKLHVVGNTTITGTLTAGSIVGTITNANLSGTNTGDETAATIQSKLGITTLSGSNTGDETTATIKTKLGAGTASLDGYLKGSDFTVFNSKQNALIGTGIVKSTGGVISYDNQTYLPITGGGYTGAISATNLTGTNTGDETATSVKSLLGITTLSGVNTGDETGTGIKTKLGITTLSGANTGDETNTSVKSLLGITTLSGANTGDETATSVKSLLGITTLSGVNTGDETGAGIKTKLGITTLSGANTGDETATSVKSLLGITTLSGANTGDETATSVKSLLGITTLSGANTGDETTPTIQLKLGTASGTTDGYLTASDWNTFNSKSPAISNATATNTGLLTAANWTTFNNKQNPLSNASGTVSGILTNTDWTTFNGKQAPLTGTGFVKSTAGVISYDNTAYLPLTGGTLTGAITATNLSGSNTGDETNGTILTKIGTLPIANGGTNATTATAALTNLLPTQTGNTGKALITDGTVATWTTINTAPTFQQVNVSATTYTALATDYHIRLILGGNQTITLPSASLFTGRVIKITNPTGYNKVTSSIVGIDQVATTVILSYEMMTLQSDGTSWNKIASSGEKSCTAYKYFLAGAWNTGSVIIGNMEFAFNATALGASTAINARCVGSLSTLSGTQTVQKFSGATYTGANSVNNSYTTIYSLLVPAAAASSVDANYLKLVYYLQDRGGLGNWEITVMNDGTTNVSMKVVYTKP